MVSFFNGLSSPLSPANVASGKTKKVLVKRSDYEIITQKPVDKNGDPYKKDYIIYGHCIEYNVYTFEVNRRSSVAGLYRALHQQLPSINTAGQVLSGYYTDSPGGKKVNPLLFHFLKVIDTSFINEQPDALLEVVSYHPLLTEIVTRLHTLYKFYNTLYKNPYDTRMHNFDAREILTIRAIFPFITGNDTAYIRSLNFDFCVSKRDEIEKYYMNQISSVLREFSDATSLLDLPFLKIGNNVITIKDCADKLGLSPMTEILKQSDILYAVMLAQEQRKREEEKEAVEDEKRVGHHNSGVIFFRKNSDSSEINSNITTTKLEADPLLKAGIITNILESNCIKAANYEGGSWRGTSMVVSFFGENILNNIQMVNKIDIKNGCFLSFQYQEFFYAVNVMTQLNPDSQQGLKIYCANSQAALLAMISDDFKCNEPLKMEKVTIAVSGNNKHVQITYNNNILCHEIKEPPPPVVKEDNSAFSSFNSAFSSLSLRSPR